jgi:diphthamide synthase (EF-2-diphthine--ammonia ligase)
MNVVALVSGGKDSCYAMMKCMEYGHQVYSLSLVSPLFGSRENPGKVNKRNIWVVCM